MVEDKPKMSTKYPKYIRKNLVLAMTYGDIRRGH